MTARMDKATLKAVMAELGRRGGASKSEAKRKAVRGSLAKARESRWLKPDTKPETTTKPVQLAITVRRHSFHSGTRPIDGCTECAALKGAK